MGLVPGSLVGFQWFDFRFGALGESSFFLLILLVGISFLFPPCVEGQVRTGTLWALSFFFFFSFLLVLQWRGYLRSSYGTS